MSPTGGPDFLGRHGLRTSRVDEVEDEVEVREPHREVDEREEACGLDPRGADRLWEEEEEEGEEGDVHEAAPYLAEEPREVSLGICGLKEAGHREQCPEEDEGGPD